MPSTLHGDGDDALRRRGGQKEIDTLKPMKPSVVSKQALGLPIKERAKLAKRLLESLDDLSEAEAERLWVAERRAKEIDDGKVKLVTAGELETRIQAILK